MRGEMRRGEKGGRRGRIRRQAEGRRGRGREGGVDMWEGRRGKTKKREVRLY